jgi:hypothetical protein
LTGKPKGKRFLGKVKYKLEDNIKKHLSKIGCGMDSTGELL